MYSDATVLMEVGYVGEDVESILTRLLQAADMILKRQRGIIFIDEVDKSLEKAIIPLLLEMLVVKACNKQC